MSARDFVYKAEVRKGYFINEDGSDLISINARQSILHQSVPVNKSYVRAHYYF